ncbi:uncharacterized protein LOC114938319 [Nylanderia fulva]|uniref:uncharacterized protein LOC114938319 n=1 Tax=Nylanderia fulva TaxID=613905 RepID=UPI0010FB072D|nr:uncharacterized protein LOC114938319 [Nylanderia fulva]
MHIFSLMRILKRILCYWLPIFVVLLVVFISSISVLLGASNETNTIFNIENDSQTSNKSYNDINNIDNIDNKDTSEEDESYAFDNKMPVTAIILMSALFIILCSIVTWPCEIHRRFRIMDIPQRVMNALHRVRNVQPLPVQYANGRAIIPADDVPPQQNRVMNAQPLPVQYANGRAIIPADDVPPQQPPEN